MSLMFDHSWDHALVAFVIDTAKKKYSTGYLGRTALQKLVYFLNVLKVPMTFKFRIHHFGPFSDDLVSTLEWLQADSIITDSSDNSKYSNFKPSENWEDLNSQYQDEFEEHKGTIESVVNAMGDLKPHTLELMATLDYCFRWVHARGQEGPWKEETVEKFKEIKKDKFSDDDIDSWYEKLVSASLIEQ